jgi:2-polyprenyl-3-methyl-5-hydroxy-6-metoxy-1,4-benzoquinol methylase
MASKVNSPEEQSSFRDPDSQVWFEGNQPFRTIMPSYLPHYDKLMKSGLYDHLVKRGLLIGHEEVYADVRKAVIKPERVDFISYPYEWCFSQLKQAASKMLTINLIALQYGMILKDASAFNMQFVGSKAVLIDTASFVEYKDGMPWLAFGQFMRHFLAPLVLAHYRGPKYLKLTQEYMDGLPVGEIARDLPIRSFLNMNCNMFVHTFRMADGHNRDGDLKREYLERLLGRLGEYVDSLTPKRESKWDRYEPEDAYTAAKAIAVVEALAKSGGVVGDLGANKGRYTSMVSMMGRSVVAIDRDHDCIDRMTGEALKLVVDLNNPTPAIGWGNKERKSFLERASFQTTLALALIHHLCIGNNVPLCKVAEVLRGMTTETLIIEWIPEEDDKAQLLAKGRVFPAYCKEIFEREFGKFFDLRSVRKIGESCRDLYMYSTR